MPGRGQLGQGATGQQGLVVGMGAERDNSQRPCTHCATPLSATRFLLSMSSGGGQHAKGNAPHKGMNG